jgi:uncharacterized protein (DUF433 family)
VVSVSTEHIEVTPGICGGKPRIAGHRIKVQHVAIWHEQMGMSPEEIVATYPSITLADVHAALAYYYDHRDEIEADIKEGIEFAEKLRAEAPPSRLQKILNERNAQRAL